MNIALLPSAIINCSKICIGGAKSETNRLLLLQAFSTELQMVNASESDDSVAMQKAISQNGKLIDIGHAGTAMRFLTAYFSTQVGKEVILTGSERMKQRPIGILVQALQSLGADIEYLEKKGYPPIKIKGKELENNLVTINAEVSSQYISALLLIAPFLPNGLHVCLEGKTTSLPYLKMTIQILENLGVKVSFQQNKIIVYPIEKMSEKKVVVESDWSSVSYFYSMVALSEIGTTLHFQFFKSNSLQGDAVLVKLYKKFGVESVFTNDMLTIKKVSHAIEKDVFFDCTDFPDLAQTLMVTCLGLQVKAMFTGLHTLKIKETDRIEAMASELKKFGLEIYTTSHSLEIKNSVRVVNKKVVIDTYQDHRMALAFAPMCLKTALEINNAEVVSKSYPNFWNDLKKVGIEIEEK